MADALATSPRALATGVARRLRGADGLRIVERGQLARANGVPAGSAWVEIEADSLLDCEVAQYRLSSYGDVKAPAWDGGWQLTENRFGEPSFRLRLYRAPR